MKGAAVERGAEERALRGSGPPREEPPAHDARLTPSAVLELQRTHGNQAVQRLLRAPGNRLARFPDLLVRERAEQVKDWVEAKVQVRAHEIYVATGRRDEKANYLEAKRQVEEAWQHLTTLKSGGVITSAQWAVMKLGLSSEEYATALALVDTAVTGSDWRRSAQLLNSMTADEAYRKLASLTDAQIGDVCNTGAGAAGVNLSDRTQPLAVAAGYVKSLVSSGRSREATKLGHVTGSIRFEGTPENGNAGAGTKAKLTMRVIFKPDPAAVPADEIAFIQVNRRLATATGANRPVNPAKHAARETPDFWKVDRLGGREQGWYGLNDDQTASGTIKSWKRGGTATEAILIDAPSTGQPGTTFEFETAAVSKVGPDVGKVYATCTWGLQVDANLVVTVTGPHYFVEPSAKVGQAVGLWNDQAANAPEAARNAPGQKPLPAIR